MEASWQVRTLNFNAGVADNFNFKSDCQDALLLSLRTVTVNPDLTPRPPVRRSRGGGGGVVVRSGVIFG